jgi:hypothetical protein
LGSVDEHLMVIRWGFAERRVPGTDDIKQALSALLLSALSKQIKQLMGYWRAMMVRSQVFDRVFRRLLT